MRTIQPQTVRTAHATRFIGAIFGNALITLSGIDMIASWLGEWLFFGPEGRQ